MTLFQSILGEISKKIGVQSQDQELIKNTISEVVGVSLPVTAIKISHQKIFITTSPTIKMAIKIKEKEILSLLSQKNKLFFSIH